MSAACVPQTMQELVEQYDPLIWWTINRVNPQMAREDREDLKQDVYARIIQRDFLTTSAKYYKTRPGKFSTSLVQLVRNLATDNFRHGQWRKRNGKSVPLSLEIDCVDDRLPTLLKDLPRLSIPSHEKLVELRRDAS